MQWLPAGTTFNSRFPGNELKQADRWEYVGTVAEDRIQKRYINKFVGHEFAQGAQNPIAYVNVDQ